MVGNDAVSAMEEQPGPSTLVLGRPGCDSTIERLIYLQSALADLLCVVGDDAWQMDANLDDAHELIRSIRMLTRQFRLNGTRHDSRQQRTCDAFESARIAENDAHEIFAGDLERFRKRQRLNLGVVEADSDRCALVKRRRAYIATLLACHRQVSAFLTLGAGGASLPPEGRVATASDSHPAIPSNPQ